MAGDPFLESGIPRTAISKPTFSGQVTYQSLHVRILKHVLRQLHNDHSQVAHSHPTLPRNCSVQQCALYVCVSTRIKCSGVLKLDRDGLVRVEDAEVKVCR